MAKRTIVTLVDDFDGTESDDISTVTFGLNGTNYSIDLSPKNEAKLEKALAGFVEKATKVGRTTSAASSGRKTPTNSPEFLAQVRSWAKEQGMDVSERGRIKAETLDAYHSAH